MPGTRHGTIVQERDRRAGFDNLAPVDEIKGFGERARDLKQHGRV